MAVPRWQQKLMSVLRIRNQIVREFMAEFIGTFILIAFGDGSVAQSVLSNSEKGGFLSINWAWGVGVTIGVYFASGISGGHLNPAVTLAFASIGRLSWKKVPFYMLAQLLGAFTAAACVFGVYSEAIDAFDGGNRSVIGPKATAGIFATYPAEYLSVWGGFGDQVFATALLMACILAITDKDNNKPPNGMEPFIVGLVVFAIGLAYGLNCGYAINPARDFGPRLLTACAGYGKEIWTPRGIHWWWVPIVGPFVGAIVGAITYLIVIEIHNTEDNEDKYTQELVVYTPDGP
ncbi:aquaporin-7-like isoform X2 [Anneissia japonica]|uniref:aquaporin-7-like isoform X2 n=1 Tax=Anneissia japonica TaxID=1529436 RepID=UPI0014256E89|nr:aquaporin-7-like isoform X2 [Anneissia japonica]